MTEHVIPAINWSDKLAKALKDSATGDTIVVDTEIKASLAKSAAESMGKTGLNIVVRES